MNTGFGKILIKGEDYELLAKYPARGGGGNVLKIKYG